MTTGGLGLVALWSIVRAPGIPMVGYASISRPIFEDTGVAEPTDRTPAAKERSLGLRPRTTGLRTESRSKRGSFCDAGTYHLYDPGSNASRVRQRLPVGPDS